VLRVPEETHLEGGAVIFGGDKREVAVPNDLLERFLGLDSDASILAFAQKFGLLRFDPARAYEHLANIKTVDPRTGSYDRREPCDMWRNAQRQFSKLLELTAELKEEERPSRALLLELQDLGVELKYVRKDAPDWESLPAWVQRASAQLDLVWHLQVLAIVCRLRPAPSIVNFGQKHAQFDLVFVDIDVDAITLFGALVVQLMAAVTGSGFANCKSCGRMYVPTRKPRQGERTYCRQCGHAAAVRDAKAAYRDRSRAEKAAQRRRK
jgi:hypothetical protein